MIGTTIIRKIIIAVSVAIGCLAVFACSYEPLKPVLYGDDVQLRFVVSIPGGSTSTRASVDGSGYTDGTYDGIAQQRYVNDAYILIFDEGLTGNSELRYVASLTVEQASESNTTQFSGTITPDDDGTETVSMCIVTNLLENGVFPDAASRADVKEALEGYMGYTLSAIKPLLVYSYPTTGSAGDDSTESTIEPDPWGTENIGSHHLPMFGQVTFGQSTTVSIYKGMEDVVSGSCDLYRSVAKLGFNVDLDADLQENADGVNFTLQEIYVYYVNDSGNVISSETPNSDNTVQYQAPDVPATVEQFSNTQPIVYAVGTNLSDEGSVLGLGTQVYYNQIYVPESYHGAATPLATGNSSEEQDPHMVIVVGGYYAPAGVAEGGDPDEGGEISYYRVDLRDVNTNQAFDIIRNHSYLFHIRGVNNVGTSDPDPDRAASGMVVEIEDYTEEVMRGINSQYTLTVNQSAFAFNATAAEIHTLEIETDGTLWSWDNGIYYRLGSNESYDEANGLLYYITVDNEGNWRTISSVSYDSDGNEVLTELTLSEETLTEGLYIDEYGDVFYHYQAYSATSGPLVDYDVLLNWLNFTVGTGNTSTSGTFEYTAEPNVGTWEFDRYAYIYITAGSIKKQIRFVQVQGDSANSAIVTKAGTYAFNATERGNGGSHAETESGDDDTDINLNFPPTLDKDEVALIDVIWETSQGLVTVTWDDEAAETFAKTGCVKYRVNDVQMTLPDGTMPGSGYWSGSVFDPGNGGNALIGAFDNDNLLLWTWHVWVIPDYADGVKTELWATGYEYMDRNLGAYSNLPGSKSFGLLYQWGRKDPFIGAYRENREQDYHTVPKQYTYMHVNPATGSRWAWGDWNDDTISGSDMSAEHDIMEHTIQNPTTILDDGLLSGNHNLTAAHGLWGCESTDVLEEEHGSKTMWDPCPEGYRVPTLNALTVDDGENDMWYVNSNNGMVQTQHASQTLRYVPIVNDGNTTPWQTGGITSTFVSDAPFYGFWLEYGDGGGTGNFASTYSTSYGVGYYDTTNDPNFSSFGYIDGYVGTKPDWATWIPLAGIYNGSMDHFGRAGMTDQGPENNPYLPASSLHVTSVLWGNSPTATNSDYPGGLLLHGTEGAYTLHNGDTMYEYSAGTANGTTGVSSSVATEGEGYWTNEHSGASNTVVAWWTGDDSTGGWNYNPTYVTTQSASWTDENGMPGSGRHFHSFADPTISTLANPSYAASVRCIVDKGRLNSAANTIYERYDEEGEQTKVHDSYDLYQYVVSGSDTTPYELTFFIYSVESWQISNPGAKWISVSPLSGNSSDTYGDLSEIIVKYNTSSTAPEVGTTATLTVKFLTGTTQTITISYAGVSTTTQP